ncbi:Molybdopterin synthase catalytic subunit [Tenacibaculum maritimum]|uniref:molybdenum cofactor biosynthesis protein MoaE n=1 Tax=Tenacibaculum maritimum TaxID=107401 RepID=UPI0012E63F74|nr:molybdenum cofactor biosynthesis protein MoaE [Tenacibaculum maritimum]CAA0146186.1 Molybdopterin synthase catalytic subunit [Tenacibaculum maritimum]CAA0161813.1 Molybdopterin synthase catalytic subunit [Tenacibaculum maritimum]CAA0210768.1 Molybdopterin synthase catalytic subunit [Tenacibaculum maritimum]
MDTTSIKITSKKLSIHEGYEFVRDDSCGGIATFIGTVRNATQNKEVTQLDFSTYKPMAIKEMQKIADTALEKFKIKKIAIHHSEGLLEIGDIPVIIAVSAPHRKAAFQACEYAIDTLKETVPIWKKEFFTDGEVWVNAHP